SVDCEIRTISWRPVTGLTAQAASEAATSPASRRAVPRGVARAGLPIWSRAWPVVTPAASTRSPGYMPLGRAVHAYAGPTRAIGIGGVPVAVTPAEADSRRCAGDGQAIPIHAKRRRKRAVDNCRSAIAAAACFVDRGRDMQGIGLTRAGILMPIVSYLD